MTTRAGKGNSGERRWYERFPWGEVAIFVTAVSGLIGVLLHQAK